MNYTIRHHIIFPLPANDNCGTRLAVEQGSSVVKKIKTLKAPGPSQGVFMRVFEAVRANIERGYYDV